MVRQLFAWLLVALAISGIAGGLSYYKANEFKAAQAAASMMPEPSEAVAAVRSSRTLNRRKPRLRQARPRRSLPSRRSTGAKV